MDTLNINIPHAQNVCKLAFSLFVGLKPLHHLGDEFKNILMVVNAKANTNKNGIK